MDGILVFDDEKGMRDFHIWLANPPDNDRSETVVLEVTPRIRSQHPGWSVKNLNRFVKQRSRTRISGMLMLDPKHADPVGKSRATLGKTGE